MFTKYPNYDWSGVLFLCPKIDKLEEKNLKKAKWTSLLTAAMLSLGLAACSNDSEEVKETSATEAVEQTDAQENQAEHGVTITENDVTFTDSRGHEVTIEKNPQRVVSVFNSFLDIWMASGGEVVGTIEPSGDKPVPGTENAEIVGTLGAVA